MKPGSDISCSAASSLTDSGPSPSRSSTSRRVPSARALKIRSRDGDD